MNTQVKAIILAGGKGHRLDKYQTAKPLVRVGGRTLLSGTIGMLRTAGITDITVFVSHDDEVITPFIMGKFGKEGSIRIVRPNDPVMGELHAMLSVLADADADILITACDLVFESNPYKTLLSCGVIPGEITALTSNETQNNHLSGAKVRFVSEGKKISSVGTKLEEYSGLMVGAYLFSRKSIEDFQRWASAKDENYPDKALMWFAKEGRLALCSLGNTEWYDVNTPEILIRAELLAQHLVERRITIPFRNRLQHAKNFKPTTYFYNKKKIRTDIIVKRGIIKHSYEQEIIPDANRKSPHFILTDKRINELYGKKMQHNLEQAGWKVDTLVIEEGEGVKAIETYAALAQELLERGIDKRSIIISLGGGVINNISGFLAATLYRGIGLIHIPTTLLAQDDAAIGIKQGVNGPMGKNLIGAKYSPMRIIVDPDVLATLSEDQIRDGLNECLKHAVAQDKNFYEYLMAYEGSLTDPAFLEAIVRKNIDLKIKLMQNDFDEEKEALVLLYGHEVGHAIEYLSGFTLGHGESIAIGMRVSMEVARLLGIASSEVAEQHARLFAKYGITTDIPKSISIESIMNMLRFDKKFHGGDVYFALIEKIGKLKSRKGEYLIPVSESIIINALESSYAE